MKFACLSIFLCLLYGCDAGKKQIARQSENNLDWIDTVRFNSPLTPTQQKQVFCKRNFEEDYQLITDTNRVALRFFWWRSFHPYMVVRLENRPEVEIEDISGKRKIYEEWFAMHKVDLMRLNQDCPVRRGNKCYGKPAPYVWQQNVKLLPVGVQPTIITALDSINFWQMSPVAQAEAHTDGSSWTLEVYCHGRYHEVTTDRVDHPIKKLCLRMLTMSGYKPTKDEIY